MPDLSLDSTYGAMLIGLLFATFFQGVLTVQAYIYYESFPEDSWYMKTLVAGVWCLDTLHLVFIAQATYHYLVTNWGNPEALMFSVWQLDVHLAILGLATISCQTFFLLRIWVFSNKNRFLIAILSITCLTTLGLDISMSELIIKFPMVSEFIAIKSEVISVFTISAGVDVIISVLLCYYLQRGRSGFEKTNSLIAKVMQYAIATGLLTSMLAVGCVIAYLARPDAFIYIAMHFSLGRMYTNALLATLNSRRNLRAALDRTTYNRNPGSKPQTPGLSSGSHSTSSPFRSGNFAFPLDSNYQGTGSLSLNPEYSFGVKSVHDHDIELHSVGDATSKPAPLAI